MKICYYIFLSMILVEKAQYNSCCFSVVKRRKITMQWSHVKTFEFVCYCFYCLTSIFLLFCFCEINFDVFTIFLSFLILKKKCAFHSWKYIYQWNLSLTKYTIIRWKGRRRKLSFSWLQEVIFPLFFSCFECKYVLIALIYGKIK